MSVKRKNPIPLWDRETYVYRIYTMDGRLLYVGITDNVWTRIESGHRKSSEWFPEIGVALIEKYQNRRDAIAVESWSIAHERPAFNLEPGVRHLVADELELPVPIDRSSRTVRGKDRWSND